MSENGKRPLAERTIEFFPRYLHHPKGPMIGMPFELEQFQKEFLTEFCEELPNGRRRYRLGILGVPRGNGKTPLAAGLGVRELITRHDAPDVFCAASTKDQAKILLDFARGFIEFHPRLTNWVQVSANFLKSHENDGRLRVLASHGLAQHGLSVSAVLIDELHAFMSGAQEELFNAMWTAMHKRPDSYLLTITTAGYDKSTLLGQMYDQALELEDGEDRLDGCLRIRRDRENGILFYWYGIPEKMHDEWDNRELWRLVNPASWVNVEDLVKQLAAPGFSHLDFRRLHLNMWTPVRDLWLPAGKWAACASDAQIPEGAPIYVAADASWRHDCAAVAYAYAPPDGSPIVLRSRVWSTRHEVPHDVYVSGGRMRLGLMVEFIAEGLARRFNVKEVVYDPTMFLSEAEDLEDKGFRCAPVHPASSQMIEGAAALYQAVDEGTVTHAGDPTLSGHIDAVAADLTNSGWRIRKMRATSPIDAAICAVLAHWRAERRPKRSVYEREGKQLWVIGDEQDEDEYVDDDEHWDPWEE